MTHPTDPVAAMREACVKHVADAIAACYRRAWTSPDEMRGATGALKRLAVSMANLPLPAAPAPTRPRVSTAGSGQEARLVVTPAAPSRPADDGAHEGGLMARVENHLRGQVGLPPAPIATPADDAVALLVNARKCVELVNDNGYYDVWLARCNRVLANAAGRTTPADDPLGEAREALLKAARVAGPIVEQIRWRGVVLGREEYEALFAVRDAAAALLAAERAQDAAKGGE